MNAICDRYEQDGTLARYVARTAGADEGEEFENHYLTCARCQQSVQSGIAARLHALPRRTARRFWVPGVALAAALAGILIGERAIDRREMRDLGRVDVAPVYLGAGMRSNDQAASDFDAAMRQYSSGDFKQAAASLLAVERISSDVMVNFFRGSALLMSGDAAEAEAELTRVIQSGDRTFADESRMYRAKARLQRGDRGGAVDDLRVVAANPNSGLHDVAVSLLARVND